MLDIAEQARRHFEAGFREGEAPAKPCFLFVSAWQEPRPPGFETASNDSGIGEQHTANTRHSPCAG